MELEASLENVGTDLNHRRYSEAKSFVEGEVPDFFWNLNELTKERAELPRFSRNPGVKRTVSRDFLHPVFVSSISSFWSH